MSDRDSGFDLEISRRELLAAAGLGAGAALAAGIAAPATAMAASGAPIATATPPVAGLHLQFGADASSQMVVSWHTLEPVQHPRVLVGLLDGKLEQTAPAATTSYVD